MFQKVGLIVAVGLFTMLLVYSHTEVHIFAMDKPAVAAATRPTKLPTKISDPLGLNEILTHRSVKNLTLLNGIAYEVQHSIRAGVPVDTIMLILLLPVLATIVAFFRHVVGIPSLGIIVPVALSITLLSTGIGAGVLLLTTIIVGSICARILFKRIRIMQLSKVALSLFVISIFIFIALTVGATFHLLTPTQSSIFPVLLLILLSERIVSLQMERNTRETVQITLLTIGLGILGYLLLSSRLVRNTVLLYPEIVLLVLPINILIGRYFGLRITEYLRFRNIMHHGS